MPWLTASSDDDDLHPSVTFADQTLRIVSYYRATPTAAARPAPVNAPSPGQCWCGPRSRDPQRLLLPAWPRSTMGEHPKRAGSALSGVLGQAGRSAVLDLPMSTSQAATRWRSPRRRSTCTSSAARRQPAHVAPGGSAGALLADRARRSPAQRGRAGSRSPARLGPRRQRCRADLPARGGLRPVDPRAGRCETPTGWHPVSHGQS